MTLLLTTNWAHKYDDILIVFMNTSQENDATLDFIHKCEIEFDLPIVWLEAVVHHGERKANTHKVVDYHTACRDGSVYEEHIKKYGIPNQKFCHCTRGLKLEPFRSYLKSIGWKKGTYHTAIGIRDDESRRRSKSAEENNIIYPLMDWEPRSKPDVNSFWESQSFRLDLAGYQGNCKWCWKKSFRKLLTLIDDDPSIFDFPARMERDHLYVGPEFRKPEGTPDGYHRTFFRGNLSVKDLMQMYKERGEEWMRAENDAIVYSGAEIKLDLDDGCVESCEIDFEAL